MATPVCDRTGSSTSSFSRLACGAAAATATGLIVYWHWSKKRVTNTTTPSHPKSAPKAAAGTHDASERTVEDIDDSSPALERRQSTSAPFDPMMSVAPIPSKSPASDGWKGTGSEHGLGFSGSYFDLESMSPLSSSAISHASCTPRGSLIRRSLGTSPFPSRWEHHERRGIRFKKLRLAGNGSSGSVFMGFDDATGALLAAKEFNFTGANEEQTKRMLATLRKEISVIKLMQHPNVVRYFGGDREKSDASRFYILMEYVAGGSIAEMLTQSGPLSLGRTRDFAAQLLAGLDHIHSHGIVHRDLKGGNLLLAQDGTLKIVDFGSAKPSCDATEPGFHGTPGWMAPEQIREEPLTFAADIWAVGCCVLEMLTAKVPFSQVGNGTGAAIMIHVAGEEELDIPFLRNQVAHDFVSRCLQKDPSKRPTAAQLFEHPFCNLEINL